MHGVCNSKTDADPTFTATENVVQQIFQGFDNVGHAVFSDSYCTSPDIVKYMKEQDTGYIGTVRAGRKNMPSILHASQLPLHKGSNPVFAKCAKTNVVTEQ